MSFFISFRSARKKLHVTVFFDHPVEEQRQDKRLKALLLEAMIIMITLIVMMMTMMMKEDLNQRVRDKS